MSALFYFAWFATLIRFDSQASNTPNIEMPAFSRDGRYLAMVVTRLSDTTPPYEKSSLIVLDAAVWSEVTDPLRPVRVSREIGFSWGPGDRLVYGYKLRHGNSNRYFTRNLSTEGQGRKLRNVRSAPGRCDWSIDGHSILMSGTTITRKALSDDESFSVFVEDLNPVGARFIEGGPPALFVVCGTDNDDARSHFDTIKQSSMDLKMIRVKTVYECDHITGFYISPNSKHLAFLTRRKKDARPRLEIIDYPDAETIAEFEVDSPDACGWSGDSRWIAFAKDKNLVVYSPGSKEIREWPGLAEGVTALFWQSGTDSPYAVLDGNRIAVLNESQWKTVYRLK